MAVADFKPTLGMIELSTSGSILTGNNAAFCAKFLDKGVGGAPVSLESLTYVLPGQNREGEEQRNQPSVVVNLLMQLRASCYQNNFFLRTGQAAQAQVTTRLHQALSQCSGAARTQAGEIERARAGLYDSFPALLHDLKNAGQALVEADPIRRMKAFFLEKKAMLQQSAHLGVLVLLACLVIYVIVEIGQIQRAGQGIPITAIGNVTYVSAQEDDRGLRVDDPIRPPEEVSRPVFLSLPGPDAELDSEDYVVRSGETLEDICAAAYGTEGYGTLVAAFNGLEGTAVEAGTVLRMPRRDQLSQYLGNR